MNLTGTATLPRADEFSVDARVLLCALLLGGIAALLFGVLPALRSAQPGRVSGMRSRATARSQRTLVSGEVALAFVLLSRKPPSHKRGTFALPWPLLHRYQKRLEWRHGLVRLPFG